MQFRINTLTKTEHVAELVFSFFDLTDPGDKKAFQIGFLMAPWESRIEYLKKDLTRCTIEIIDSENRLQSNTFFFDTFPEKRLAQRNQGWRVQYKLKTGVGTFHKGIQYGISEENKENPSSLPSDAKRNLLTELVGQGLFMSENIVEIRASFVQRHLNPPFKTTSKGPPFEITAQKIR